MLRLDFARYALRCGFAAIKIDRSFIIDIDSSDGNAAIVRAVEVPVDELYQTVVEVQPGGRSRDFED